MKIHILIVTLYTHDELERQETEGVMADSHPFH